MVRGMLLICWILVSSVGIFAQGVKPENTKNQVIVLGMIHGTHLKSESYGIAYLKEVIRLIEPDVVLTEIPPDRLDEAVRQFKATGTIEEARVKRFPEYVDALFPLTREMNFEIVPTAGWTKPMADARRAALNAIEKDSARSEDWRAYREAMKAMDEAIDQQGREDDPLFIHSDAYDAIIKKGLGVYDRLFNDELGPGGWTNINRAHYALIAGALDRERGKGRRILITFGAGHKYWFLEQLRERTDIELVDPKPFLREAMKRKP